MKLPARQGVAPDPLPPSAHAKEVISMAFQEPELKKVSIRRAAVKL